MSERLHSPDLEAAAAAIESFLDALGLPDRNMEDLRGTGRRVAAAFSQDLLSGYGMDPQSILSGGMPSKSQDIVSLRDIPVTTLCPHHLLPGIGTARLELVPGGLLVGFGELVQLVDCFSRRLTLQEHIGRQVVDALSEHLQVVAARCVLQLTPTCLTERGHRASACQTVTVAEVGDVSRLALAH